MTKTKNSTNLFTKIKEMFSGGKAPDGENENNASCKEPLLFEKFCFTMNGMSAVSEIVEGAKTENGGMHLAYYHLLSYYNGAENICEKNVIAEIDGGRELYEETAGLFGRYGVVKWNGFCGPNPRGLLDGWTGSFKAELSDGSHISASGSNNFPKTYYSVLNSLKSRVQYEKITGTHLELENFSIDIPETWRDVMTLYHDAGYTAFETEIQGELKATLIIDNNTYGYSKSYDTAYCAGRLEKDGESTHFITVRENYHMKNFEDSLTTAQKAVSADFNGARRMITESITGIGGWKFIPEEGETESE